MMNSAGISRRQDMQSKLNKCFYQASPPTMRYINQPLELRGGNGGAFAGGLFLGTLLGANLTFATLAWLFIFGKIPSSVLPGHNADERQNLSMYYAAPRYGCPRLA